MKTKISSLLILFITIFGCKQKSQTIEANFYKDSWTGVVYNKVEFEEYLKTLYIKHVDTTRGKINIGIHNSKLVFSGDSIIQPFKYDIRLGNEYIIRANSYEKIGMKIPSQKFLTITGDSINIGGKQKKPILINLWFIGCPGCIKEISDLNRLKKKYADKVDFIAMTFESEKDVKEFLKRKEFNFSHVANSETFIKQIGTKPYPENIFINKEGDVQFVEGPLANGDLEYFESNLKKLLQIK